MSLSTEVAADDCWWLSPAERTLVQPELDALRTWHTAPAHAIAARSACPIAVQGADRLAAPLVRALETARLRVSEPSSAEVVVVIASDEVECWASPPETFERNHMPLLLNRAYAQVGPIVIPGKTPCLRCCALHRADAGEQFAGETATTAPSTRGESAGVDPVLTMLATTAAVAALRHWIDAPHDAPTRRLDFQLPDLSPRSREVRAHHACGCLWQN